MVFKTAGYSRGENAYEAYERLSTLDPYSVKNLLLAHKIMMEGLVKEAGIFRSGNVGVYAGEKLILVYENQDEYYKVLQRVDGAGESTEFVEFMLVMIRDALREISEAGAGTNVAINVAGNGE